MYAQARLSFLLNLEIASTAIPSKVIFRREMEFRVAFGSRCSSVAGRLAIAGGSEHAPRDAKHTETGKPLSAAHKLNELHACASTALLVLS